MWQSCRAPGLGGWNIGREAGGVKVCACVSLFDNSLSSVLYAPLFFLRIQLDGEKPEKHQRRFGVILRQGGVYLARSTGPSRIVVRSGCFQWRTVTGAVPTAEDS